MSTDGPNIVAFPKAKPETELHEGPDSVIETKGRTKTCRHPKLIVDYEKKEVHCGECGDQLTSWDAVVWMCKADGLLGKRWAALKAGVEELTNWNPRLKAVRELHKVWSTKHLLPVCPHCHLGVEAEDMVSAGSHGRDYDQVVRLKRQQEDGSEPTSG